LEGIKLGLSHDNDNFLKDSLNARHFLPESAFFFEPAGILPHGLDDIKGLVFLPQLNLVKYATALLVASLGDFLLALGEGGMMVEFDGVIASWGLRCILFESVFECHFRDVLFTAIAQGLLGDPDGLFTF
jgi:hypothetical protein